ncbi:MAG: type II secretion system F family protein [Proteobacteria bacterium]|jgi:tight adherence protein C|nr:type II secretion system F family protein [Alphaproteobacteria bacterium]NCC04104.1 type II secretion system F family protein [Pseudomonadota bacterium]
MGSLDQTVHNPNFLAGLCGLAAFVVVMIVWTALIEGRPNADRLKAVTQRRDEFENERRKKNSRRASLQKVSLMKQVVAWLKLTQGKSFEGLRLKLRRAGYQSRDAMFVFLFTKVSFLAGAGATSFFFLGIVGVGDLDLPVALLASLFGALIGWYLPDISIKNMSQKRENILKKAMPDALDLMVICAEAGLGLDAAFERVGKEMGPTCPELAEEIGVTSVELNFMPDRHKALHGLAERVPLPSVIALVNTLIQTERYGTPLAQSLRVLSAEMREERIMKAEEKAAKLPAVLTVPMILFILPPLFVVLIGPAAIKVGQAMSH